MSLLGIIGAMEEEVIKLKEMMTEPELIKKSGMDFYKGTIEGKNVVVVKCKCCHVYTDHDRCI